MMMHTGNDPDGGTHGRHIIENPILNSPFREPDRHWRFTDEGITNEIVATRREAYFIPMPPPKKKGKQLQFDTEWTQDRIEPNDKVNRIRERVKHWREGEYQGITQVTRKLLQHWTDPDRENKLFFCQIEALETLIYLTEAARKVGDNWMITGFERPTRVESRAHTHRDEDGDRDGLQRRGLVPWVVSDFLLIDAIESGIVKIPRVPAADDTIPGEPPTGSTARSSHQPRDRPRSSRFSGPMTLLARPATLTSTPSGRPTRPGPTSATFPTLPATAGGSSSWLTTSKT